MIRPEILRRIQPTGIIDRVRTAQGGIMGQLLQSAAARPHGRAGRARRRDGRVLAAAVPDGPARRRLVGAGEAGHGDRHLSPQPAARVPRQHGCPPERRDGSSEVRALVRGELRALDRQLQAALPGATDEITRRHLQDCRDEIAESLDRLVPRRLPPPAARSAADAAASGRSATCPCRQRRRAPPF